MSDLPKIPEGFTLNQDLPDIPEGFTLSEGDDDKISLPGLGPYATGTEAFTDRMKFFRAGADLAFMGLRAGGAEIVSGYAGLIALALSGDINYAAKRVDAWQNFFMGGPYTKEGKDAIEAIAPSMSKADASVTNWSEDKAGGNPELATAIKTGIYGSLDIIATAIPGAKTLLSARKLNKLRKQVMQEANRLGIELKMTDFADDVADAARTIGSESPGEAATEYVKALRNAENRAKIKKNSLYRDARTKSLHVETSPIRQLGDDLTAKLDDAGYDLDADDMAVVRRSLDDFHSRRLGFGRGQGLAVHFSKVEMLRKRINRRIEGADGSSRSALTVVKRDLDDWLNAEFSKASFSAGGQIQRGSALSGDLDGYRAYLKARKAAAEHGWFSDNKVIADMVAKDTTPEQVSQWIFGASALGAKKEAGLVVKKLKALLGEDHPSINAIRADFVYHIVEPLFAETPNFKVFANRLDTVLRKNKTLADELGLQAADVQILADYAKVARHLHPGGHLYTFDEVIQTVARLD
jgi:hypothetical protein